MIHFTNARLIDPERGTDAVGDLLVRGGVIAGGGGRWRRKRSIAAANVWRPVSSIWV